MTLLHQSLLAQFFGCSHDGLTIHFPPICFGKESSNILFIKPSPHRHFFLLPVIVLIMVLSSHAALNKRGAASMRELNHCISHRIDSSVDTADLVKPVGLHFMIEDKIFKGTNQPFFSCPIQFLLRDQTPETKVCQPVWTDPSLRSKVNRKAKVGVKKHSVIRLNDKKSLAGCLVFIRSCHVIKKDVDSDACERWMMAQCFPTFCSTVMHASLIDLIVSFCLPSPPFRRRPSGLEGIPPALKKAMMLEVLSVDKVKLLATEGRDDDFFHEIFINRMSSVNDARQQRQIDAPQHPWHTDGTAPHLTAVLTICDSELDSNMRSAHDVGGFVKLSNFDDGHFTPTDSQRQNHPKPSSTTTYFPKTNSLCVFPGYFVAHAVFKVHPGTVRYSVVMFIRLRYSLIDGGAPDMCLRSEWASGNLDGKKEVCHRCWSAFGTQRQLVDHKRRSIHCQNVNAS
jgi:hypothetical protein